MSGRVDDWHEAVKFAEEQQKNSRQQPKAQARRRTKTLEARSRRVAAELQEIAKRLKRQRTKVEVQNRCKQRQTGAMLVAAAPFN
jgi:molecular chaperone GrpE (heat shock protein)